jgi:hypothetical protein
MSGEFDKAITLSINENCNGLWTQEVLTEDDETTPRRLGSDAIAVEMRDERTTKVESFMMGV